MEKPYYDIDRDLLNLPDKQRLQQISKAISVLDAILSQEWIDRYYSYNSKWSVGEEFLGMRNDQGDEMLILFYSKGCVINGMAHEYYPKDKPKLTSGLPNIYQEFIFGEPVHSIGTTFCIWSNEKGTWQIGDVQDFNDGSKELLHIFNGNPQTYIDWAIEYYEEDFVVCEETFRVVSAVYEGQPLTKEMVLTLYKELEDWKQLVEDLDEIGYPHQID